MKKLFLITIFTVLVFGTGCKKFLTEQPVSQLTYGNFDANSIESATVGVYEPFTRSRGRLWETHYTTALTLMEDYSHSRYAPQEAFANYDFTQVTYQDNFWPTFYQAISRANTLIQVVTSGSFANGNKYIAEARFVRAIAYYQLVRAFGKVPLRLVPVTDAQNTGQPLAEVADIYNQIISDFQFAEANLPATTTQYGRATSGAAKTALADVYLTLGRFSDARTKAKEVMDNKSTYGYELLPSFTDIFSPTSATSSEEVFALKFTRSVGLGNFLPSYSASTTQYQGFAATGNENFGTTSTLPFIKNWDNNDPRKVWTLYNKTVINGATVVINVAAPNDLLYGKFRDPLAPAETAAGNDFFLYRYADVLLIFAEAENKVNGPTSDAYNAVNMVRRRGYGVSINTANAAVDLPGGLTQATFDDLVFRERGYEFFAEDKRWFDLLRTGRYKTELPAAGKRLPPSTVFPIPAVEKLTNDKI
ncbi:RagB/SusD family nutrient uptake outer membrane protein [Mucilaginibacter sp. Mucisp86]|uniref:RagB/SusD family nutrient uptake outer membrane protein n=1 Tax=Mucilaginibacter sp. Mucisp86 TaxID=3243060 RepID=UPI0039B5011D